MTIGPIWLTPGHPDDAVTVNLGYGRGIAGRTGSGQGFSGYLLRTSNAMWFAGGLKLKATGGHYGLASPQGHQSMEGRALTVNEARPPRTGGFGDRNSGGGAGGGRGRDRGDYRRKY